MERGWQKAESAVVEDGAHVGEGTRIWHNVHIRTGARVGAECNIGRNVYIGRDVNVGRGCKIQNNVNVYEGVTLEDYVFCGPSMTFTNLSLPLPRAAISRLDKLQVTKVGRGATIGAGAVIICGHSIGEFSVVAAGAVVTRSVSAYRLVVGNPARPIGWVCRCGTRLAVSEAGEALCRNEETYLGRQIVCLRRYRIDDDKCELLDDPHQGVAGYLTLSTE